jgi:glutathione synthase/RimK-type ligase-like ATP-grasp enzyme
MKELSGTRLGITTRPEIADMGKGVLIRYGNSMPTKSKTPFNSDEMIEICASKQLFSKRMSEHGIYTPIYHWKSKPTNYPALIRTTLSSFGGKGIIVVNNEEEFDAKFKQGNCWTDFIFTKSEYRVHVLGGKVSRIFKKLYDGSSPESKTPIRNLENGYHFSLKEEEGRYEQLRETISTVDDILKGSFYGADLGWDAENKKYFVFEVNSAPGLNPNTARDYAEFIISKLKER